MAQSIWSGHIRFGLVHIPVRLYGATEAKDVSFHLYREGAQGPVERIKTRRVGAISGDDADTVVRGYAREDGEVVVITDDDLASVSSEKSKVLDVQQFCAIDEIDPVYFEKSYWLGPAPKVDAEHPLELFRRALAAEGLAAVGSFVMRSKEHVAVIRASHDGVMLHTLYYDDEVRPAATAGHRPDLVTVADRDVDMARQLLSAMRAPWQPSTFRDEYRARLLELIDAKATGRAMATVEMPALGSTGADMFSALEASVRALRTGGSLGGEAHAGVGPAPAPLRIAAASDKRRRVATRVVPPDDNANLADLTVTELRDLARRRDITGRSKMSRHDLIAALS